MATQSYPYDTPSNYIYDPSLVTISGGIVSLKEALYSVYARYKMNASSGTVVSDSSGNGRDGSTVNMDDTNWQTGKLGNCLYFNGSNEYVTMGNIRCFREFNPFTVEFWMKTSTTTLSHCIIGKNTSANGWQIIQSANDLGFIMAASYGSDYIFLLTSGLGIGTGSWQHIILTYDGSQLSSGVKLYVNNSNVAMGTFFPGADHVNGSIEVAGHLAIGARSGGSWFYEGHIDNVVLYNKVLSATERSYRFNGGVGREAGFFPTSDTLRPLIHYHFNRSAGNDVPDSSGNLRQGRCYNMEDADWQSGKLNNCLLFDGVNEYVWVDYPNYDTLAFDKEESFSVEAWFKTSVSIGIMRIAAQCHGVATNFKGWSVSLEDGDIAFRLANSSGDKIYVTASGTFTDNNWHHLITCYDGSVSASGVNIYVDNNLKDPIINGNNLVGSTITSSQSCNIGASNNGTDYYFDGYIDEVVVYSGTLIEPQIDYRYNSGTGTENIAPTRPSIEPVSLLDPAIVNEWDAFSQTLGGGNEGSVGYNLYKNDKDSRYYWNGTTWSGAGGSSNYNSASVVNSNITSIDATPDKLGFVAYLISNGTQQVELSENNIGYTAESPPQVYAGLDKSCYDHDTETPFSDAVISDPDGDIENATASGYIEGSWHSIPKGGYGTLQEAVREYQYTFDNLGDISCTLKIIDEQSRSGTDAMIMTVGEVIVTFNIKDTNGTHLSNIYCNFDDGAGWQNKSSPFDYSFEYNPSPYTCVFDKGGYIVQTVNVTATDHTENIVLSALALNADEVAIAVWQKLVSSINTEGSFGVTVSGINSTLQNMSISVSTIETGVSNIETEVSNIGTTVSGMDTNVTSINSKTSDIDDRTNLIRKILANRLELADGSSNNWVLYDDDSVTPLLTFNVSDKSGNPIVQASNAPSKRSKGV